MTAIRPYDIKGWRLALGLVTGAAVAIVYFAIQFYPIWHITLVVGAIVAVVFVTLLGLPLYFYLRYRQMLNVYVAVMIGGLLTTLPYLVYTLYRLLGTSIVLEKVSNTILIADDKLTSEGWWYYFLWQPMWFFAAGMIGGLVAWIVAVGFRVHPRRVGN